MDWTNRTRSIASKSSTLQGRSTAVVKARGWGAPAGAGGGGSAPEGVVRAIAKAGGDESAPHARARTEPERTNGKDRHCTATSRSTPGEDTALIDEQLLARAPTR